MVPGDRAAVLKTAVEFTASKVGQGLGPRRLSAFTVAYVAPVVIAKKRAEIAKARPGENAPQAIITFIEAAMHSSYYAEGMMVEQREFKQLMVGDQARALQYMLFAERVSSKIQGLTAKPDPLDVAGIEGTGIMGGDSPRVAQRLARRCSCSSSGRIVRCACQVPFCCPLVVLLRLRTMTVFPVT